MAPVSAQLGMQLPSVQPAGMAEANQEPALDQADDWAQFINLDADADEDGQAQAEQANGAGDQQVSFQSPTGVLVTWFGCCS